MAKRDRMSGNEAVATAMRQINPDVMGAFLLRRRRRSRSTIPGSSQMDWWIPSLYR